MTERQFAELINALFQIASIFMPARSPEANERIYDLLSAIVTNIIELADLLIGDDAGHDGQ